MTPSGAGEEGSLGARLRQSKSLILVELIVLTAIFAADEYGLIYISKTLYLLAFAWLMLAARGVRWRDLGFRLAPGWPRLVLIGVLAGFAMSALELLVTQPLLVSLTGEWPDLSDFRAMIGDGQLLLLYVALAWTLGAFGEELVWRGWALNRLIDLFGESRLAAAAALLVMSMIFGFAHGYQGMTGVSENVLAGLLLGGLYFATGRNLVAPIIAHGVIDTVDFGLIYLGRYPGM